MSKKTIEKHSHYRFLQHLYTPSLRMLSTRRLYISLTSFIVLIQDLYWRRSYRPLLDREYGMQQQKRRRRLGVTQMAQEARNSVPPPRMPQRMRWRLVEGALE
jgi:hypothetical protein